MVLSTYNTPTIITWIGPWRYVILCINLYFSSLCMMMGRMTDREEKEKKSQERKRITWRTQCSIYILIPGAAMVIREMTTWEMPFTAAFYRGGTRRVNLWKVKENIVSLKKCVQTVEWPSLLPFSSVTAMPFRISLKKKTENGEMKGNQKVSQQHRRVNSKCSKRN